MSVDCITPLARLIASGFKALHSNGNDAKLLLTVKPATSCMPPAGLVQVYLISGGKTLPLDITTEGTYGNTTCWSDYDITWVVKDESTRRTVDITIRYVKGGHGSDTDWTLRAMVMAPRGGRVNEFAVDLKDNTQSSSCMGF